MYAFTSLPLVRRTRATFRKAELGFLGVVVYTRVHTPRFCGQASIAGTLLRASCHLRGLRMSWFIVGMVTTPSNETTARRLCHAGAVVSHYSSFNAPFCKSAKPCACPIAASTQLPTVSL